MSAHFALAYRTVVFWHRVGTLRHSDTLSAICLSRPPWMNFPATSPDIYHPGNRMRRKDASTAFNGRSDSSTAEWMKVGVHFHLFSAEGWVWGLTMSSPVAGFVSVQLSAMAGISATGFRRRVGASSAAMQSVGIRWPRSESSGLPTFERLRSQSPFHTAEPQPTYGS